MCWTNMTCKLFKHFLYFMYRCKVTLIFLCHTSGQEEYTITEIREKYCTGSHFSGNILCSKSLDNLFYKVNL